MTERGADMAEAPGGSTGLLVRQYQGALAMPVYTVAGHREAGGRGIGPVARELGQWREKRALTVNGAEARTSITVQFVRPGEVRPSGGD